MIDGIGDATVADRREATGEGQKRPWNTYHSALIWRWEVLGMYITCMGGVGALLTPTQLQQASLTTEEQCLKDEHGSCYSAARALVPFGFLGGRSEADTTHSAPRRLSTTGLVLTSSCYMLVQIGQSLASAGASM